MRSYNVSFFREIWKTIFQLISVTPCLSGALIVYTYTYIPCRTEENKEGQGQENPVEEKPEDSDNEEGKTSQTDPAKKKFIVPPKRFVWDATTRYLKNSFRDK